MSNSTGEKKQSGANAIPQPSAPSSERQSDFDPTAVVDLGQYVQVIIDWYKEILLLAIVAGAMAGVAISWKESKAVKKYTAVSTVAIARVKTDVTFDERFRTLSAEDADVDLTNPGSRRAALVGLVSNGLVAMAVIDELADMLSDSEKLPANLLTAVDAHIIEGLTARTEGDLIRIEVTANLPVKAAAIANSWAKHYVVQVNNLYGKVPTELLDSIDAEVISSQSTYESTQRSLEEFVATNQMGKLKRLINEKLSLIESLQSAKQIAIDTLVEEELNSRRQVISAYMKALSSNRLFGFNREQEAKREILDALFDTEVQTRLEALKRDRESRETLFVHLANAQIASTTAVIDEEVQNRIDRLRQAYDQQIQLNTFLQRAQLLKTHIESTAKEHIQSTGRSLALLKAQLVYLPEVAANHSPSFADAVPASAEGNNTTVHIDGGNNRQIQLNVDIAGDTLGDRESQLADVNGLITAIELELKSIEQTIDSVSSELLTGENYPQIAKLLSSQMDESDASTFVAEALLSDDIETVVEFDGEGVEEMTDTPSPLATPPLADQAQGSLSATIVERYEQLLSIGELATDNSELWKDSSLLEQIMTLYPELYRLGPVSELSEEIPMDNPLTVLSLDKAQELLQLHGLEDIPAYTAAAEPLIRAIDKLEREIQQLRAQLEAEESRERQLLQQRDLAWNAYSTMTNKATELKLAQSATNGEVRLAAPAVEPIKAKAGANVTMMTIIGTIGGMVLGIAIAYLSWFLGYEPFLRRRRRISSPMSVYTERRILS